MLPTHHPICAYKFGENICSVYSSWTKYNIFKFMMTHKIKHTLATEIR